MDHTRLGTCVDCITFELQIAKLTIWNGAKPLQIRLSRRWRRIPGAKAWKAPQKPAHTALEWRTTAKFILRPHLSQFVHVVDTLNLDREHAFEHPASATTDWPGKTTNLVGSGHIRRHGKFTRHSRWARVQRNRA